MLPEPVSIVTTALSIAGSAYKISKDTYDLIQGIRGAPSHITPLSKDRSTTSSTNTIVQQIQKDVQQLKHQADNRDREESTRQSQSEDDHDGSLNDDREQCPADHRLSTVSSDLSIRRFLVEAETLVSSLAGGPQPPAAVVSEPLNSNENPQNDLSNDDTAQRSI